MYTLDDKYIFVFWSVSKLLFSLDLDNLDIIKHTYERGKIEIDRGKNNLFPGSC